MKAEDIYNAVTELRDDQIQAGERKLRAKHPANFRRLGVVAALLAAVILSGVLAGPRLAAALRERKPDPTVQIPGTTEPPASTEPAEPDGSELKLAPFTLSAAVYPRMAQYPNELDYETAKGFDDAGYEAAWSAWRESVSALQSEIDYTQGLTPYLRAAIPVLLADAGDKNRVASPLNIYMALAMLAESTAGESRAELLKLLNVPDLVTLRERAKALWQANYRDDGQLTELLAASLWLRDDMDYNKETVGTLAENYYSSSFSGKMGSEDYTAALQSWMNEQTKGLLSDQIEGIELYPETVLALVTTVYYKAAWQEEFRRTETRSFQSPAGERSCEFLLDSSVTDYYSGKGFTAAGKSLLGSGSMYFLLPEESLSPEELLGREEVMDFLTDAPGRSRTEHRTARVNLAVPKFDVSAQLELREKLETLGVLAVFDDGKADFSPLCPEEDGLSLTRARHGARLMIDEKGVTGAAYTLLGVYGALEPQQLDEVELTLDRPFLFVVTNNEGLPLFVGVVNNP